MSTWITVALAAIKFVTVVTSYLHDRKLIQGAEAQVVAAALGEAQKSIAAARRVEIDAAKTHADDATDGAFDKSFQRKD